jgi:hypothetical protein
MRSLALIALLAVLPSAPPVKEHRVARIQATILEQPDFAGRPVSELSRCDKVGILDEVRGAWVKVRFWGQDGYVPAGAFHEGPAYAQNVATTPEDTCDVVEDDDEEPAPEHAHL